MKYLQELRKFNFPKEEFAVFGSGPLAIRNIRENEDIDIIVKKDLWEEIAKNHKINDKSSISIENIEIWNKWEDFDIDELIDNSDIIEGLRFVKLEEVLKWKRKMGREKDIKDINLIERFMKT